MLFVFNLGDTLVVIIHAQLLYVLSKAFNAGNAWKAACKYTKFDTP